MKQADQPPPSLPSISLPPPLKSKPKAKPQVPFIDEEASSPPLVLSTLSASGLREEG